MNKLLIALIVLVGGTIAIFAATNNDTIMKKQSDGTCIVNTTTLCKTKGFRDVTPIEVYIKNGKVVKVLPLANKESPNYFEKVKKHLLPLFYNVKVNNAKKVSKGIIPDGCTGATYSTQAVQANITAALEYYQSNK